jgi:hypothetical protein
VRRFFPSGERKEEGGASYGGGRHVEEGKAGGWYGALTGCGGRPAAGRGRGGGDARSVRDRKGSEMPTGGAPTIVMGGDGLV